MYYYSLVLTTWYVLVLQGSGVFAHEFDAFVNTLIPLPLSVFYLFLKKDQTTTFMHEATEFFVNENVPRFVGGEDLLNHVDKVTGY